MADEPIRMDVEAHDVSSSSARSSETEETDSDTSQRKVETKSNKTNGRAPRLQSRSYASVPTSSSGNLADLEELEQEMEELSLRGSPDDSIIILPNKKSRREAVRSGGESVEYVPKDGEVDNAPKKKRCVEA